MLTKTSFILCNFCAVLVLAYLTGTIDAWNAPASISRRSFQVLRMIENDEFPKTELLPSRRDVLTSICAATGSGFLAISPAFAQNDDPYGTAGRKEMESVSTQTPQPDRSSAPLPDVPFINLDSGVKYKEFKAGTGDQVVAKGSRVYVQLTGRLLNLNGVKFFSTKDNVKDELIGPEPFVFTAGAGQLIPGLEEGILGMKKGSVRRIVVPSKLGYSAGPGLQPQPIKQLDKNALDSVLKNPRRDASLLFDVQVERIK